MKPCMLLQELIVLDMSYVIAAHKYILLPRLSPLLAGVIDPLAECYTIHWKEHDGGPAISVFYTDDGDL